jgi:hypothetical protein
MPSSEIPAHSRTLLKRRWTSDRLSGPDEHAPAIRREGGTMPTVLAYHDVKDTDHWLASPKREEFFGPLGVTNIRRSSTRTTAPVSAW